MHEKAIAVAQAAATDIASLGCGKRQIFEVLVKLSLIDNRPDLGLCVQRVADHQISRGCGQLVEKGIMDAGGDDQAR